MAGEAPSLRGRLARAVLGLGVSALTLWWVFKDVDLGQLVHELGRSDPLMLLVFGLGQVVIHFVRVLRWGLIITPIQHPGWRSITSAASIGIPAAMFLPFRLGEFVRPAVLARTGYPFPAAVASVVSERLVDGLTNVVLFFLMLALLMPGVEVSPDVELAADIAAWVFGGACAVMVALAVSHRWTTQVLLPRLARVLPSRYGDKLEGAWASFLAGARPLGEPRRLVGFVVLTALFWGINGATTTMLAHSYGLDVPWFAGWFAVVMVVFAVTLPAGPAFAGTMSLGFYLGLKPFGVSSAAAAVLATAVHIETIVIYVALYAFGVALSGQRGAPAATPQPILRQ